METECAPPTEAGVPGITGAPAPSHVEQELCPGLGLVVTLIQLMEEIRVQAQTLRLLVVMEACVLVSLPNSLFLLRYMTLRNLLSYSVHYSRRRF